MKRLLSFLKLAFFIVILISLETVVSTSQKKISSQKSSTLLAQPSLNEVRKSLTIEEAFNEAEKSINSSDCNRAIQLVSQIIALSPDNLRVSDTRNKYYILEAYRRRGYYYYTIGQYQNAILDYNKIITSGINHDEELIEAVWGRGKSRYELQDSKGAIQDITQGINIAEMQRYGRKNDSFNVRLRLMHTDRGIIRHTLGDVAGAFNDYENGEPNYCNEHNKRLAQATILGKRLQDSDFPRGLKPSMGILIREQCRSIIYGTKKGKCRASSYYPFD
jgi:tetratricopeptide (TPR) repeat protein